MALPTCTVNAAFMYFGGYNILLDFTGELDGASDVPAVQVELRVEVLVCCDGCGVVRTGTLGHVALSDIHKSREQLHSSEKHAAGVGEEDADETLTPL